MPITVVLELPLTRTATVSNGGLLSSARKDGDGDCGLTVEAVATIAFSRTG